MSNKVFEEAPQQGGAATDKVRKAARQLAYDTRYKVKQKFKDGQKADPASLKRAYLQQLGASSAPGPVKALAKKMLIGEEYDVFDISENIDSSVSNVFAKVFVEGGGAPEVEEIEEAADTKYTIRVTDKKTKRTYYRKADRAKISELRNNPNIASVEITGRKESDTYDKTGSKGKKASKDYDGDGKVESGSKEHAGAVHNAIQRKKGGVPDGQDTRKEEVELSEETPAERIDRISKANVAKRAAAAKAERETRQKSAAAFQTHKKEVLAKGGRPVDALDSWQKKKMKKEEVETVDEAFPRVKGTLNPWEDPKTGKSTVKVVKDKNVKGGTKEVKVSDLQKEGLIYEKEENGEKKLDVMKGKNIIKVNPTIGESIRAELDAIRAQKLQEQEAAMKQQEDEKRKEQLAKQQASKDKQMKLRILQNKMRAVRSGAEIAASHEMQGDTLAEGEGKVCEKCGKSPCECGKEDEREAPTKATLFKNKLRARGIQVAGLSLAPRNMKTYDDLGEEASDRARDEHQMRGGMAARVDYDRPPAKKLSNKELGIKPGKTWVQKQMEKK
jgi:hypothetical protein